MWFTFQNAVKPSLVGVGGTWPNIWDGFNTIPVNRVLICGKRGIPEVSKMLFHQCDR